jgi:uncharacterized protein YgiM (DUF1202 family)
MVLRRFHKPSMKQPSNRTAYYGRAARPILVLVALLALTSVACSVGQTLVGRSQAVVPTPTKTPRPTFTPMPSALTPLPAQTTGIRGDLPPGVTVQPLNPSRPAVGSTGSFMTPGVQISGTGGVSIILYATETPEPSPTPEPAGPTSTPTPDVETNRPERQSGPRPLPTPYVIVNSATLNGRRGPAATFERIGQAEKGAELMIMARTPDGAWWQVCCMSNQPVWVSADQVEAKGPVESVPVVTPAPTPVPPPPAAPKPTATPAPTPMPPFDIARGPEFPMTRENGIMTIWTKVYEGPSDNQSPLPGYILKVFRDGVDVSQNMQSFGDRAFDTSNPSEGTLEYNLKFEMNNAGEADWEIYLAKPGGFRVSPVTKFTTKGDSYRNQVVYIAYRLAR